MWRRQLRGLSVILHPLRTTCQRVKTRLHLSERSARRAILIFAPALASMMTGCVQYVHKPIDPAATLSAIEARSLDDAGLKRFLDLNHAAMGPDGNWNLRMLTLTAFYFRPELDEARAAAEAAATGQQIAAERPNPQIQPNIGYDTTTAPPWIPGVGLTIPIETAGKRRARVAVAGQAYQAAEHRIVSTAWQVRVKVRRTMLAFVAARRSEEILGRQAALQERIVQLLQKQLDAGAISPFELTQARLAALNARLAVDQARLQRASAGAALADAIGISPLAFDQIASSIADEDISAMQIPDATAQRQALVSRSDILAALADYETAQASLQLEVRRQYPDVSLGPGYLLDQTDNKFTMIPTITLPLLNRNRGEIAHAAAIREQAAAHVTTVETAALLEISQASATLRTARQKLATADSLLATARGDEQQTRNRYKFGDVSLQEVLNAQLVTVAAEAARSDALLQANTAAGALEDAIQSPLGFESILTRNPRP